MKYPKALYAFLSAVVVTTSALSPGISSYAEDVKLSAEEEAEKEKAEEEKKKEEEAKKKAEEEKKKAEEEKKKAEEEKKKAEEAEKSEESKEPTTPEEPTAPEKPEEPEEPEKPEEPEEPQGPEASEKPETPQKPETSEEPETSQKPEKAEEQDTPEEAEQSGESKEPEKAEEQDTPEEAEQSGESKEPEKAEKPEKSEQSKKQKKEKEREKQKKEKEPDESKKEKSPKKAEPLKVWEEDLNYSASAPFIAIGERIRYNAELPIEGIPSFITQEMIVGALKVQDETGYPASVTIAQIIQESGFGKYGPGGKEGKGLSYLAYQYCNLFGIKGSGTAGSAVLNTFEMTAAGKTYHTRAGFRAYHTYTECIEDRCRLLMNSYSDLTENVKDANTFAMKIGKRWATGIHYGQSLIRVMERYDLYRLDEMTLMDFSDMIGRFADPCPGSVVTSTFGYRTFDNKFHKGLDMGTGGKNIPTYAAEAGTVTFTGAAGSAGNLIVIDHGDGLVTKYMHHAEIYVEEGQHVEKGQQIGLAGTTGRSTGIHLHFQVEENGKAVNPMKYLQDKK